MTIEELEKNGYLFEGWHVIRFLGEGSYGKVYEIEREEFGTKIQSAFNLSGSTLNKAYNSKNEIIQGFMYIVFLDIGSKYISVQSIKTVIDTMAESSNQLKYLMLDWSKNRGFRLELDDTDIIASDGNTYSLTDCYGGSTWDNKVDMANNYWLSETDMTEVITYAMANGVEIIPCFTMPGNMFALLEHFTEFRHSTEDNRHKATLNYESTTAVNFIAAIVEKYARYFYEHGCHEALYTNGNLQVIPAFVNRIANVVRNIGLIPMVWNDGVMWANDYTPNLQIGRDIVINYWRSPPPANMVKAFRLDQAGFKTINSAEKIYYCPKTSYTDPTESDFIEFIQNQTLFECGSTVNGAIGAMFCTWFGNPKGISEADAISKVQSYIRYYGNAIETYGERVVL